MPGGEMEMAEAEAKGVASWPRTATIGDSLRASIVASDAAGLRSAWEHVRDSKMWRVIRMKNKFRDERLTSPNLHVNVLFSASSAAPIVAEVQIHYVPVIELKKSSHKLYQITRADSAREARG